MKELRDYHKEVLPLIVSRMKEVFADIPGVDLEGGKHLRGTLCVLVSDALGGDRDKALDYAAAVDGLHLGTLQHDDILDLHTERRGKPTAWVLQGIKAPIIYGDRLMTLAQRRMGLHGKPEMDEVIIALDTTVQAIVRELSTKPWELAIDFLSGRMADVGYRKLCLAKTAPFFRAAAKLGAMAASSEETIANRLADYGQSVGLAYQYADDLVDIVNLQKSQKLPAWDDVIPVLPAIIHYNGRNIREAIWEVPLGIFRDVLMGKGPLDRLLALVSQLDVAQQLEREVRQEVTAAGQAVDGIRFKEEYGNLVRDFPRYAVGLMLAEVGHSIYPTEKKKEEKPNEERTASPAP